MSSWGVFVVGGGCGSGCVDGEWVGVRAVLSVSVQQAAADGKHEARWPLASALTHLTWGDPS